MGKRRKKSLLNRINNNMRRKMDGGTWSNVEIDKIKYEFRLRDKYRNQPDMWLVKRLRGKSSRNGDWEWLGYINHLPKDKDHLDLMLAFAGE